MNDTLPELATNPSDPAGKHLAARINRLAGLLGSKHYPSADRAALKRHTPGQTPPLAFYRLWLRHLGDDLPHEGQIASWALLSWGLAHFRGNAHRPERPLGQALSASAFAEARLERLLETKDDATRERLFTAMIRFLAAKGEGFDWLDAARLLLTVDADKRESVNRCIASSFYRKLNRNN